MNTLKKKHVYLFSAIVTIMCLTGMALTFFICKLAKILESII